LANGNFELDRNGDDWPDGWSRPKSGGAWANESGNRFLRLKPGMPDEMIMVYLPVPVPANAQAFELKWRQRITDLKPGKQPWFDARIILDLKDSSGKKLKPGPSPPYTRKSTDGWVERSTKFLVPPGSVTLEVMPALFQVQTGTFDLDDFSLTPIDPAPLEEAAKDAAKKSASAKSAESHASFSANYPFAAAVGSRCRT
jgi:hypothetical protein